MSNDNNDETFLSRWSRQKRQEKPKATSPAAEPKAAEAAPDVDVSQLPNVEELTAESDITAFLQKGVPEALKKLALRRMWSLDPAIRDFVEVAENQWDFNAPGGIHGLYEDLAEGTDVSVWMAQATQSLVREDVKDVADDTADSPSDAEMATARADIAAPVAVQHASPTDDQPSDAVHRPASVAAVGGSGHARQHADAMVQSIGDQAAPALPETASTRLRLLRRRLAVAPRCLSERRITAMLQLLNRWCCAQVFVQKALLLVA
jgi:hypothetical protein